MRRTKQICIAVMAAACIMLLVWLSRPAIAETDFTKYAAAAKTISAGKTLTAEDIVLIDLPTGSLPADYFTSIDQVIGLSTTVRLSAGELLNSNQLAKKPHGVDYPFQKAGTRLMTIELPANLANGFWLAAGSRVDIDMIDRSSNSDKEIVSLENIEVVAVLPAGGPDDSVEITASNGRPLICLALNRAEVLMLAEGIVNRQVCLSVICPVPELNVK